MEKTKMDVPEEVLAEAAYEALDKPSVSIPALKMYKSDDAWDVLDATEVVRYAAPIIAEWARKEALREAADAVDNTLPDPEVITPSLVGGWTLGKSAASRAVHALALAEGGAE